MTAPIDKKLAPKLTGTCKFYDPGKQFGFIAGDDGHDRFFNANHILPEQVLCSGARVEFIAGSNRRGLLADRVAAVQVRQ
ncbi:cold-shock protein [Pseudoduganella sp. R-34]|uniref:cold-shock protein n=1 Tax=Pseudoduganella sp. R-34 TaxID=3404062 RepID=UPI003CF2C9F9